MIYQAQLIDEAEGLIGFPDFLLLNENGEYQWSSGHPMTYTDFVNNPGSKPFIHLTPGNGYAWNTKNDQNDTNNGCLCRLDRN